MSFSTSTPGVVTRAHDYAIHGSAVLGVVAVTKVLAVCLLLGVQPNRSLLVIFLVTVTVYTHNKLLDLDEDMVNLPDRASFVESHRRTLTAIVGLSYLGALLVATTSGPVAVAVTLVPLVAGLLYGVDWIPVGETKRLKEVFVANTALVAFAWAVPLALLPTLFDGRVVSGVTVGTVLVFFFVRTFLAVEVFNVRDVVGDRREGIATLPVVLGVSRSRYFFYAFDLLSILVVTAGASLGALPASAVVGVLPAVLYSLAVTSRIGYTSDVARLCTAYDMHYPLLAAGLFLASSNLLI